MCHVAFIPRYHRVEQKFDEAPGSPTDDDPSHLARVRSTKRSFLKQESVSGIGKSDTGKELLYSSLILSMLVYIHENVCAMMLDVNS